MNDLGRKAIAKEKAKGLSYKDKMLKEIRAMQNIALHYAKRNRQKSTKKNPIVPQDYGRVPMTKEAKRIIKQVAQSEAIQAKKREKELQKAIAESAKKRNAQARARYKAKKEAIALKKAQKPSIKKEETTMARAKKRTTRTLRSAIKTRRLVSYVTKKGRKIPLRKVRVATGGSCYGKKKNNAYVGKIREGLYVYKKKMA